MNTMKKLILFVLVASSALKVWSQSSCCEVLTSKQNTLLALNKDFAKIHMEPLPFTLPNPKGEMITFNSRDGKSGSAYLVRSPKGGSRYLFVFHEWWGLNDYIKREAEHFREELGDVNVLAIDLYDGKVASTREEAQKLVSELDNARAMAIIKGACDFTGEGAKIASMGWCMGGSWSLQAALTGGGNAIGCVIYYGYPEMNEDKLKKLRCDILGIFGDKDQYITPEVVEKFNAKLKESGKQMTMYHYDADHAFANPSNPNHDAVATKDAWMKTIGYLKEKFQVK